MLAGARVHSAWRAAADSDMEVHVSAYFTSVHITVFWKGCDRHCRDSKMEVSAYITSVHITVFWKRSDKSGKEVYTSFTSKHIPPFTLTYQ